MGARLLTYDELSASTGVVKGTLKRWKHEGMPAVELDGGRVRFLQEAANDWIRRRRSDPNKLRRLRDVTFSREACVYFGRDDAGRIKIGWTSDSKRREYEVGVKTLADANDVTLAKLGDA